MRTERLALDRDVSHLGGRRRLWFCALLSPSGSELVAPPFVSGQLVAASGGDDEAGWGAYVACDEVATTLSSLVFKY